MNAKVVLCTTTFYPNPNDVRAGCALSLGRNASRFGYPLVVVDNSGQNFRDKLAATGALVFAETDHGMGPSRRQAMRLAAAMAGPKGVVVWLEAEKDSLPALMGKIVKPILRNHADMVIPNRQLRLFWQDYPPFQARSEYLALKFMQELGYEWDEFFGPFAVNQDALSFFLNYPENLPSSLQKNMPDTWDATHVPRFLALAGWMRVKVVKVPYRHPPEQREQETDSAAFSYKRIVQLKILEQMYQVWKLLLR